MRGNDHVEHLNLSKLVLIELSVDELDTVTAGKATKAAPVNLFKACATGEHIKSATIIC